MTNKGADKMKYAIVIKALNSNGEVIETSVFAQVKTLEWAHVFAKQLSSTNHPNYGEVDVVVEIVSID